MMQRCIKTQPRGYLVHTVLLVGLSEISRKNAIFKVSRRVNSTKHESWVGHAQRIDSLQLVSVHLSASVLVFGERAFCKGFNQSRNTRRLSSSRWASNDDT